MDKLVIGMAIALGAIAVFLVPAVLNIGLSETIVNNDPDYVSSVNDCGQRFYMGTPGGKFHSCPGMSVTSATITEIAGFPACMQMYGNKNQSYRYSPGYDFVLRPNSTGYITLAYDFGTNELPQQDYFKELYTPSDVHRLSEDGSNWIFVPSNQTSLLYYVAPENVTKVNPTTIKVTYTIETKNTKVYEVGNTYLIGVYAICGGQFITIGDKPYTGRLPLD